MKKIILKVILGVCIVAVVGFTVAIVRELLIDRQSQSFYDDLAATANRRPEGTTSTGAGADGQSGSDVSDEQDDEWQPFVDFEVLKELYPGIVGWILLDGTPINYPIMQHTNNDYFLTRLPDGTPHRNGSIFLDYRNESDFSDKSILIYGHESRTEEMFATLKNYRDQEFYDANPVIHLYTPEKDYKIAVFAGHLAHSQRDHPPMEFETDEEFLTYIEHIKSISLLTSDIEINADDRIVNLCTCAYDFNEARLVIVGVLVE